MLNYSTSIDRVFHALADPARRVMIEQLCRGPASVSALAAPLDISLPAVMQHLDVLQASGLVRSEKVGRVRTCRVEPAVLRTVEQWVDARRSHWERAFDRLGEFLAAEDNATGDDASAPAKPPSNTRSNARSENPPNTEPKPRRRT